MKKKLSLTIFTIFATFILLNSSTSAAENDFSDSMEVTITTPDGQQTTTYYDLSELFFIEENEDEIVPLLNIGEAELKNGHTFDYYNPDGTPFYVVKGSTVTFKVTLKSSAHVLMGFVTSSDVRVQTYNDTNKTNTTTFTMPNTGYYRFYITNASADTIEITGGSISF